MRGNPFGDTVARENSNLHFVQGGKLAPFHATGSVAEPFLSEAHTAFRALVKGSGFSCIGAKAAFNGGDYGFAVYDQMSSVKSTAGLTRDLCHFVNSEVIRRSEYATFVAVFRGPLSTDETRFEELLWQQLRALHQADREHFRWDARVNCDPTDPRFSFSFAGQAFYVIGMHAGSSRLARQFPWPTLVFNPHEQFERLRSEGKWGRMQASIRAREVALQGNVNPMLSNFGDQSEARQYSGRIVEESWQAPFPNRAKNKPTGKCPFGH
jgi:FPC/CPF motif-containing protein YcgG